MHELCIFVLQQSHGAFKRLLLAELHSMHRVAGGGGQGHIMRVAGQSDC